jgi:hypothetical protein
MQRRALAVQCCTYLKQQALAVERLARCNNDVGATCILQGTLNIFYEMGRGNAAPCVQQCSAAPTSNSKRWRSSASRAANIDVGATCILQGTLNIFTMEGGYAVLCCLQCFAAPT